MSTSNYFRNASAIALTLAGTGLLASCNGPPGPKPPPKLEAPKFVEQLNHDLVDLNREANAAGWTQATDITVDTQYLNSKVTERYLEYFSRKAGEAKAYDKDQLDAPTARSLNLLKLGVSAPAPADATKRAELASLTTELDAMYGEGKYCPPGTNKDGRKTDCKNLDELSDTIATSRNYQELTDAWAGWHTISRPMRPKYQRFVELANEGAKELGFRDVGAMWRAGYDMPADDFTKEMDRLWMQVKPLYDQLHCYVRARLHDRYGDKVQAATGPIRADLLGNMWAQEWGNIYDLVAPKGAGDLGFDIGELLEAKKKDPVEMVKMGEGFYSSLGLAPLPATFWQRSQITRPRDREVVCHASAWDLDNKDDLRIKMCTKVNSDDFVTIHHELGHNYYQRAYNQQPYLYLNGANGGFHEAIGDFIALSITPEYLVQIGLLDRSKVPSADKDVGLLLRQAMDKVAFMPFSYLVDKWRWGVFDGTITPANYNQAWVDLKLKYQGIVPPVQRTEADFDPGAKFHIPGNTSYERYFIARVLQFQFYKAACDMSVWKGPLHRCSFYGNKEVGQRLNQMLAMGASKPWPDALQAFTGTREISGRPMLEYFAPLQAWLEKQNAGKQCGW